MSGYARVTSVDVLQTIAVALQKFSDDANATLDDLDVELHRALEWIQHDRKEFWKNEYRRCDQRVAEARVELLQAQSSRKVGDFRPSCVDEQRALERAKQRFRIAEQKIQAVKHWTIAIERAVNDCQRSRIQFSSWINSDMEKAIFVLNQMSDRLESYLSLEVPADPNAPVTLPTSSQQEESHDTTPTESDNSTLSAIDTNIEKKDTQS